jgi:hypothetical protein
MVDEIGCNVLIEMNIGFIPPKDIEITPKNQQIRDDISPKFKSLTIFFNSKSLY